MEQPSMYDIIIVGSGPAGAIAARVAAECGYKVLILEKYALKQKEGRYKACGGALAWEIVDELRYPEEKIERIIESLELHHVAGEIFSKKGKGAIVWRGTFDKYLCDIAVSKGAIILDNEPALSISKKDTVYEIQTTRSKYTAKYLIAADGVTSTTLRCLNWPRFHEKDLVLTITHEIKSSPDRIASILGADKVHLFFGIQNFITMGYAWLFPKSDVISIGWGNRIDLIKNLNHEYQIFQNTPLVQESTKNSALILNKAHLIPVGVRPLLFHENVFALGDAAGFVDPISGKGIPYAMFSGQIAIESLKRCENKGTLEKLGAVFERNLNTQFLTGLKMKYIIREKIFKDDNNLKRFLALWQTHRSSEIIAKRLFEG